MGNKKPRLRCCWLPPSFELSHNHRASDLTVSHALAGVPGYILLRLSGLECALLALFLSASLSTLTYGVHLQNLGCSR